MQRAGPNAGGRDAALPAANRALPPPHTHTSTRTPSLAPSDRAHRIGQASSVNVYFLCVKGSIDEIIWATLQVREAACRPCIHPSAERELGKVSPTTHAPPPPLPSTLAEQA